MYYVDFTLLVRFDEENIVRVFHHYFENTDFSTDCHVGLRLLSIVVVDDHNYAVSVETCSTIMVFHTVFLSVQLYCHCRSLDLFLCCLHVKCVHKSIDEL